MKLRPVPLLLLVLGGAAFAAPLTLTPSSPLWIGRLVPSLDGTTALTAPSTTLPSSLPNALANIAAVLANITTSGTQPSTPPPPSQPSTPAPATPSSPSQPAAPSTGGSSPSASTTPPPAQPSAPTTGTLGAACKAASDCGSGFCVEGVCCNSACSDASSCDHCAVAHGATTDGTCTSSAELPRARVDTATPPAGLPIHQLADGEDLQHVLDSTPPPVEIDVPAGRTFSSITLPARPAGTTAWTVLKGVSPSLPGAGQRLPASATSGLPKLLSTGVPAISTAAGASHYWIVGFEIAPSDATTRGALVRIGDGSAASVDKQADHVILDRVYLHGLADWGSEIAAGVEANGAQIALVNSRVDEIHTQYQAGQCTGGCVESKGFVAWNGPGPYKIANSYVAASSHNLFFGGNESASSDMMPRDIEITGNHLHKPLSWWKNQATPRWQAKTMIELKVGERVEIRGNYVENEWNSTGTPDAPQIGHAIVFSPRNGDSAAISPWSAVADVAVRDNKIVNASRGLSMGAQDDRAVVSGQTRCMDIVDNLFDKLPGTSGQDGTSDGRWLTIVTEQTYGTDHVRVQHNTAIAGGETLRFGANASTIHPNTAFSFKDNLVVARLGVDGDGSMAGQQALAAYAPGGVFARNDLVGGSAQSYGVCSDYGGATCDFFSTAAPFVDPTGGAGERFDVRAGSPDDRQCSEAGAHALGAWNWSSTGLGRADAAKDPAPSP